MMCDKNENGFWRVCEALDCELRIGLLRYLLEKEETEFPCVNELAKKFCVTNASISVHLKKLAMAGLVSSKRSDRRVYYRAFATTPEAVRVIAALRPFFATQPDAARVHDLLAYAHALSHARRNAIVRVLNVNPSLRLKDLAIATSMPPQTADRLRGELGKAHIVDLNGAVVPPPTDPEATLLDLTLAQGVSKTED